VCVFLHSIASLFKHQHSMYCILVSQLAHIKSSSILLQNIINKMFTQHGTHDIGEI